MRITMSKAKQNKSGTWTIRVRWTTELGERHEHTVTRDTKWETEAKAAEYARKKQQLSGGNPKFLDYLREYVDMRKRALNNYNSEMGWERTYQRAAEFFTPQEKIQDITTSRYQSFLYCIGRKYAKSSNQSVSYRLKRALEDAKDRSMIATNPAKSIKTASITGRKEAENQPKKPLNAEETYKLIDYLLKNHDYTGYAVVKGKSKTYEAGNNLVILTAILTGMREGEIAGLRWEDIDPQKHTIKITHQVDSAAGFTVDEFMKESKIFDVRSNGSRQQRVQAFDGLHIIKSVKTAKSNREIIAPDILFKALERARYKGEPDYSPIFKTRTYRIIGRSNLSYKLHAILDKLDLPSEGYHFHSLRHTHVALLLYEGVNLATISDRLGHSSIDLTLNKYSYEVEETKKRDESKIYSDLEDFATGKDQQKSKDK